MVAPLVQSLANALIIGFLPAFRDASGWQTAYRRTLARDKSTARRVIYEDVANRDRRVLVDVNEYSSATAASARLPAIVEDSNIDFVKGLAELGPSSLAYPGEHPRSIYLAVGNLLIWVLSCGRERCDVTEWVTRIVRELSAESAVTARVRDELVLSRETERSGQPGPVAFTYSLPWDRGEWAWYKFTSDAGTMSWDGNRIWLQPASSPNEITLTGWALEPGRETYRGVYAAGR